MKTILLALVAIGALTTGAAIFNMAATETSAYPAHITEAWALWKQTHRPSVLYTSRAEENYRLGAFAGNYNKVETSNANPEHTHRLSLNKFADLTTEEFTKQYLGYKTDQDKKTDNYWSPSADFTPKDEVDWTLAGQSKVHPVEDQGQCGSCWAFSSVGAIEGLWAEQNPGQTIPSLAKQQLVDCAHGSLIPFEFPNMGCHGGNPGLSFEYTVDKGLMPTSIYPYTAQDGHCQYDAESVIFHHTGHHHILPMNNYGLKCAVSDHVVSVGVDGAAIQLYKSGIYNGNCSYMVDHGVLAVGYGTENGQMFWKIKNSWGAAWGEEGFYRLERSESVGPGKCAVATRANYAT